MGRGIYLTVEACFDLTVILVGILKITIVCRGDACIARIYIFFLPILKYETDFRMEVSSANHRINRFCEGGTKFLPQQKA